MSNKEEEIKEDYAQPQIDPSGMNIELVGPMEDGRNQWLVCGNKFEVD
jgi:hypothetical protein